MATATGQAPVSNNTPSYGGNWGNNRFNRYYNRYLNDIPLNTVDYNALSTQEQTVDELAQEVAAYLDPQLNTTEKNLRRQLRNNYNDIDAGNASRGTSRSTIVTDQKNAAYNAGMDTLADAYNNYGSALASGVSERYENYLARRQGIDEQNARNQLEVDKYNSQVKTAQEQLAYQRAANAYNWTKPKPSSGGGGSDGGGDTTPQKQGYYGTLTAGSTGSSSSFGARRNQVVRMTDGGGNSKPKKVTPVTKNGGR